MGMCEERTENSLHDSEKQSSVGSSWEPESWKVAGIKCVLKKK